jgi:hypothetical protein
MRQPVDALVRCSDAVVSVLASAEPLEPTEAVVNTRRHTAPNVANAVRVRDIIARCS